MAVTLGPITGGMNNRARDNSLPDGTARNVVNADIDNAGKARRRKGLTKIVSCVDARGAYSCPLGTYFVEGTTLKKFNGSEAATTVSFGILGDSFAWEYFNGVLYFSDGLVTRKINSVFVLPWGLDNPSQPTLYQTSGSLDEGQYLAALTYVNSEGVESGSSEITSITCSGGIVFDNLPLNDEAEYLRLYLSTANGSVLYQVAEVSMGTASYPVIAGGYDENKHLETEFITKPPAGSIIRHHKGRLHIVYGSVAYETVPYSLDYVKHDFTQYPDDIDVYEPVSSGIFVAAGDRTYFKTDEGIQEVLTCGAVKGSGKRIPNSSSVSWMSIRGLAIGHPDGSIELRQEQHVATGTADSSSILLREQDGLRQAIISMKNPTVSPLAASSFIAAEIVRKGA